MNNKIDREDLQNLIIKADEYYQSNNFINAINSYIEVINQLTNEEKKDFHHVFCNLGSCYLQLAFVLIDKDKNKSIQNALLADKAFEIAAQYNAHYPDYFYYIALAKTMVVSEGLNKPDDIKQLSAAIFYFKKAKKMGCTLDDLNQRLESAQQQSNIILARINKDYEKTYPGNISQKSPQKVTFSSDTLFNDGKNSTKTLKQKSDNQEPESGKKSPF